MTHCLTHWVTHALDHQPTHNRLVEIPWTDRIQRQEDAVHYLQRRTVQFDRQCENAVQDVPGRPELQWHCCPLQTVRRGNIRARKQHRRHLPAMPCRKMVKLWAAPAGAYLPKNGNLPAVLRALRGAYSQNKRFWLGYHSSRAVSLHPYLAFPGRMPYAARPGCRRWG